MRGDIYSSFHQKNDAARRHCYHISTYHRFMPGLGAEALGGFLAGATVSGVLMGMFQNNAGGAWDNAKNLLKRRRYQRHDVL